MRGFSSSILSVENEPSKFRAWKAISEQIDIDIRQLEPKDAEHCFAIEEAAFTNADHRCTLEKFEYRLSTCPELCFAVCGRLPIGPSLPVAHIVATRTAGDVVTDAAMGLPHKTSDAAATKTTGHVPTGTTIALHSLAVHPLLHTCGVGSVLMKAYIEHIKTLDATDRIALICQEHLLKYYARFGFYSQGPSTASFGGGGWHDMVLQLKEGKNRGGQED